MKTIKLILFWFVHCTWGIIMTLVGSVGALVMLVTGHKPKNTVTRFTSLRGTDGAVFASGRSSS